jgi:hypothetical protein
MRFLCCLFALISTIHSLPSISAAMEYTACSSVHGCCNTIGGTCGLPNGSEFSVFSSGGASCGGNYYMALDAPNSAKKYTCIQAPSLSACSRQTINTNATKLAGAFTISALGSAGSEYTVTNVVTGSVCKTTNHACAFTNMVPVMEISINPSGSNPCLASSGILMRLTSLAWEAYPVTYLETCMLPGANAIYYEDFRIFMSTPDPVDEFSLCPITTVAPTPSPMSPTTAGPIPPKASCSVGTSACAGCGNTMTIGSTVYCCWGYTTLGFENNICMCSDPIPTVPVFPTAPTTVPTTVPAVLPTAPITTALLTTSAADANAASGQSSWSSMEPDSPLVTGLGITAAALLVLIVVFVIRYMCRGPVKRLGEFDSYYAELQEHSSAV